MITASAYANAGETRFECAGQTVKHGSPDLVMCEQVLMVWRRPPSTSIGTLGNYGIVEVKCRRCKTVNTIILSSKVTEKQETVVQFLS